MAKLWISYTERVQYDVPVEVPDDHPLVTYATTGIWPDDADEEFDDAWFETADNDRTDECEWIDDRELLGIRLREEQI